MQNLSTLTMNNPGFPQKESQSRIHSFSIETTFKEMQKNIKLVRSPIMAIRAVITLEDWIRKSKLGNQQHAILQTLKEENGLHYLRKVRGDGNCFIRAVAFQYLAQLRTVKLEKCFPYIDSVILTCSEKQYIPKNFQQFYDNQFLCYCLKQNWEAEYSQTLRENSNDYKVALASLLAQNPYLDFIICLYMRAVSVLALRKFKDDQHIAGFLQDNDEDKLRNYGNLSDGLTQFLLSRMLEIEMNIYEVRASKVLTYFYPGKDGANNPTVNLLFKLNHYDLLQTQADIHTEVNVPSLQKVESFYSGTQIQDCQLVEGQCLNCQQETLIYLQSCLCEGCYIQTKTALDQFKRTRMASEENIAGDEGFENDAPESSGALPRSTERLKPQSSPSKRHRKEKKKGLFGCFRS